MSLLSDGRLGIDIGEAGGGGGGGGGLTAGGVVLLGEVTVGVGGQANIDFTNITQAYKELKLVGTTQMETTSTAFEMRVGNGSIDTGSNYNYLIWNWRAGGTTSEADSVAQTSMNVTPIGTTTANRFETWEINIRDYNLTDRHKVIDILGVVSGSDSANNTNNRLFRHSGTWRSTSAIDQIRLFDVGGVEFAEGSVVRLYGVGGVPAITAGALTLIEEVVVPAAGQTNIDFTGISSAYKSLRLEGWVRSDHTTVDVLEGVLGNTTFDTGNNYNRHAASFTADSSTPSRAQGAGVGYLFLTGSDVAFTTSPTGRFTHINIDIHDYAGSNEKSVMTQFIGDNSNTAAHSLRSLGLGGGTWRSTSAIDRVRLLLTNGDFEEGSTIRLYGVGGVPTAVAGWSEVETIELASDGTITFSNIPQDGRILRIVGQIKDDDTTGGVVNSTLRVGSGTVDAGASYDRLMTDIRHSSSASTAQYGAAQNEGWAGRINDNDTGENPAARFSPVELEIYDYADTSRYRQIRGTSTSMIDTTADRRISEVLTEWQDTTNAIDIITVAGDAFGSLKSGSKLTLMVFR